MSKKSQAIDRNSGKSELEKSDFQAISDQITGDDGNGQPVDNLPTAATVEAATSTVDGEQVSTPDTAAPPSPVVPSAPSSLSKAAIPDLDEFMRNLTADQIKKVRKLVDGEPGLIAKREFGTLLPDGSMNITVHLDPQMVEQLMIWAESDGIEVGEEAKLRINEALTNYLYGDWGATMVKPAEPPAPVVAK